MRAFTIELFVTTILSSASLARDDSWYVSLAGEVSEDYLPIGRMPDYDEIMAGYTFGTFDGDYDFPGFVLTAETHPSIKMIPPTRQLRIGRLAGGYRDRSRSSRGFWS